MAFVLLWRVVVLLTLDSMGINLRGLLRKGAESKLRLDRALGTQAWIDLFPRFIVHHLAKSTSDHVPVLLNWSGRTPVRGRKQFRYEDYWNLHEECAAVVQSGWERDVVGSPMYQVTEKIKMTRMMLNKWARSSAKSNPREIREVEDKLTNLLGHPFT